MSQRIAYNAVDLTGQVFGRITVIKRVESRVDNDGKTRAFWQCRCACGTGFTRNTGRVRREKSCGCKQGGRRTHELSHTPEYRTWCSLKARCNTPTDKDYCKYGARGIKVSDRWSTFENFIADMGQRPSRRHTLDRSNNNLGYEHSNCHWALPRDQMRNTRMTKFIEYNGRRMCLTDWAREIGITASTLKARLGRLGWPKDKALTTPRRETSVRSHVA